MRKMLKILIALLAAALLIGGLVQIGRYRQASRLCASIQRGEEIHTSFANGTTAPAWWIRVSDILQMDGPQIPLVEACYHRNVQAVTVLLENGADPNRFFDGHWSPLEAAMLHGPVSEESYQIARLLLDHGADPNLHGGDETLLDRFAGFLAAGNETEWFEKTLLLLVDHGAFLDPAEPEENGELLNFSVQGGNTVFTETLIRDYGFSVNFAGHQGKTPLMIAVNPPAGSVKPELISLLLDYGADPHRQDSSGKSAYDYALESGDDEAVRQLGEDTFCNHPDQVETKVIEEGDYPAPPDGQAVWNGYVPPVDRIETKEDAIRAAQAALSSGDEKSNGQYRELGLRIQLLWHYAKDNVWLVVCYEDRDAETVGGSLEMAFSGEDASLIGAWWGE